MIARATATRCFCPPLISYGNLSKISSIPNCLAIGVNLSFISGYFFLLKTKGKKILSRLLKLSNKFEIVRVHEEIAKEQKLTKSQVVSGYAYRLSPEGVNFVTSDYDVIFVYKTNYRKSYHLGEKEEIKIIDIHEDDYTGTINKNKEFQIEDDYKIILDYLEKNNGVMLITEKSSPEIINRLFNMSKSSFKNALGRLLKQNKIEILENKIILKEE